MIHRDVMEINYVMHENILTYLKERCNSRSPALQILCHLSHQGSQLQVICTINSQANKHLKAEQHSGQDNRPPVTVRVFHAHPACDIPGDTEGNCIFKFLEF